MIANHVFLSTKVVNAESLATALEVRLSPVPPPTSCLYLSRLPIPLCCPHPCPAVLSSCLPALLSCDWHCPGFDVFPNNKLLPA